MYSSYGIKFHSTGLWSFNNDNTRNVATFVVKNSSSSQADNRKNKFLALSEVPTPGINGSFDSQEKKFSINFIKASTKFCLSLRYSTDNNS